MLKKNSLAQMSGGICSLSFGGKVCFANHMNTVMFSNVEVYTKKIKKNKKNSICVLFPKKGM